MSIRQKIYDGLVGYAPLTALLAEGAAGVHAGASLTGREYLRPFLVYRCQDIVSALQGDDYPQVLHQSVEIWVYDEPGSFARIEDALDAIVALVPNIVGLKARFGGISGELPDDEMKAIAKNVFYTCAERS